MQIKERHERILHLLEAEGMVKNAQLAALFSVTNETIRKDLEALENAEFPPPLLPVSSEAVVKILPVHSGSL